MNKLLLFSLVVLPAFACAQASSSTLAAENECEEVFTVAEQMPALNMSTKRFADTLLAVLRSKNVPLAPGKITYTFIVTSRSQLRDLTIASGRVANEAVLRVTIQQLAGLWTPARQRGRAVCAHSRLRLKFTNDTVDVNVLPL